MRRAEFERIVQCHGPIIDVDLQDVNRAIRPRRLLLARLAPDERSEIPSAVGLACGDDAGAGEADALNHDAVLPELAHAVAERNFVD